MRKKIVSLLLILSLFLAFFVSTPITLKATNESPETSSNQALNTSSIQLVDGTGYFKKTKNDKQYKFYYTNYLGTDVDHKTNESQYVHLVNRSVTPSNWYNIDYGLDLDNFESVSIIQGKWALPHEYVRDEEGNIIPESTGYLEESIYSDCRRYVYYLVYVNEDGVQRPKFDKHYECNVETDVIPEYLLNDGKNEKMGIQEGKIYNTSLLTYKAVRKIEYYPDTEIFTTEYWDFVNTDNVAGELKQKHEWRPIIYFNIEDIDYDYILSVKYSYIYAEFKKEYWLFGGLVEVEKTRKTVTDEVFNDESFNFISTSEDPLFVFDSFSDLLLNSYLKDYKNILKNKEKYGTQSISYLQKGEWTFDDAVFLDKNGSEKEGTYTYTTRIIGHSFSNEYKKQFNIIKKSVSFIDLAYCYDGVIYASDDNVPIIGEDQSPDLPTTQDMLDQFFDDLLKQLGKIPSNIVNKVSKSFITSLISFWDNCSTLFKGIIITIIVLFLLAITSGWWLPKLRTWWFRKNLRAYDESIRISNRKAYNKQHKRERKELKQDRKYETSTAIMNKVFDIDTRNYQSKEAEKNRTHWNEYYNDRYNHEESMLDKRNASFEQQRQHEVYMQQQQLIEAEKNRDYQMDLNKQYERREKRKFKENQAWRNHYKDSDLTKYEHEKYIQDNQLKENRSVRRYWNKKNNKKTTKNETTGTNMDPDVLDALKKLGKKKPWE